MGEHQSRNARPPQRQSQPTSARAALPVIEIFSHPSPALASAPLMRGEMVWQDQMRLP
jgi:hypothetical protein